MTDQAAHPEEISAEWIKRLATIKENYDALMALKKKEGRLPKDYIKRLWAGIETTEEGAKRE